jgi:hypothetical protein
MKLIYSSFAGILLLVVSACSNNSEIVNQVINNDTLVPVRVHVDGFTATQEDFPDTRTAQDVADYDGINAVTLAFYNGSTETYKVTQLKTDASTFTNFGEFECALPLGSYTMVVIAYTTKDGSPFVLTSPTVAAYTGDHSYETFAKTQTVDITNNNAVDISATLNRIVAKLYVVSSDGKAAAASSVRMTLSAGGKSFNPTTGLATVNTGFSNTVNISAAVGNRSGSSTCFFLATDEQTMNVTIETLDANGNTLFSKTVKNVTFQRNKVTKLTGAMYTNSGVTGSFQLSSDWLEESGTTF